MCNTDEVSLDDEKVIYEKSNSLISLVIICLLLSVVISTSCCYCTKHRSKQKHLLQYHDTRNKLKGIKINNIRDDTRMTSMKIVQFFLPPP